jgi:hypothetical protein
MAKPSSKGNDVNSQIEPPLGHLPLMANIPIDGVRSISLSEAIPNNARFDALGQVGMADTRGMNGLRLDAAVKRAADAPPLGPLGDMAPPLEPFLDATSLPAHVRSLLPSASSGQSTANAGPIPMDRLRADLPTFCVPILKDGDPTIDLWPATLNALRPAEPCLPGDHMGYDLSALFGQETVWFIRNSQGRSLLAAVLMWMGFRVHNEQRCPGPLERGFLSRIESDCPDAVDWVVMDYFRQHPEILN